MAFPPLPPFPLIPTGRVAAPRATSTMRTSRQASVLGTPPKVGKASAGYAGSGASATTAAGPSATDTPDAYATGDYGGIPTSPMPVSPVAQNIQQRLANVQASATDQGLTVDAPTDDEVAAEAARKKKIIIGGIAAVAVIGLAAYAYSESQKEK